ncbi:endonuclease/exonuclease/phosphatase family protein [Mucilaginibacter limnophilus]|uniref:Endonuclease/exonuclease/phosphatase family protein n=1 Tax=Mucilaginibacter limnophilus TaxID=1932778 RepID=A0A437MQC9_9SPHI|nr:endonuclease/exonuclease/phosphatase family protein [Mucilaginibacter limnophilus]RVT99852.1 endonuclease/exonuclease/phosphatase family protein [Mucilaginibacter limnophilus]
MKTKLFHSLLAAAMLWGMVANAQQLRIGTYNIRYKNEGDSLQGDGWAQRSPYIAGQVKFQDLDIFGTQEGKYEQQQDMLKMLPQYSYIGVGRDDGKQGGEFASVFYKKNKFKLLQHGDFWLSPTPTVVSKGWDAMLPRICTWGKFKENGSNLTFFFFNIHFDHVGVQARRESSKLILAKIKEMTSGLPVVLTGDFNVDQFDESYKLLNTSGVLRDVYELSPVKFATHGTFNSFDPNTISESRIDHIFVTGKFKPLRYAILSDTYFGSSPQDAKPKLRVPSDHFPVVAVVSY